MAARLGFVDATFEAFATANARWLRRFALQALRATTQALPAASALSLAACTADASGGPSEPRPEPDVLNVCENGAPLPLAPRMQLARDVDYLADMRAGSLLSERGAACETALHFEECQAAIRSVPLAARMLLSTEGDAVRVWLPKAASGLLGDIDRYEEALWLAVAGGYMLPCKAQVTRVGDDYVISAVQRESPRLVNCTGVTLEMALLVSPDGELIEHNLTEVSPGVCSSGGGGTPGRRPHGCLDLGAVQTRSVLGLRHARAAQLEFASVPAFAQIRDALRQHAAPQLLVAAAERARRDEIRHARAMLGLARRFGAVPNLPRIELRPMRSLMALAVSNVREGCVFETYAALEACHQAAHATDAVTRVALQRIARDELRHAALSHALHAWASTRLNDRERRELDAARSAAVHALQVSLLDAADNAGVIEVLGVPARRTALALHAALDRGLWTPAPLRVVTALRPAVC